MEKFSRYRDPGSGIQVFLPPVLPVGSRSPIVTIATPLAVVLGLVRATLLLAITLLWSIFGVTLGNLSSEVQANLTSLFGRVALFIIGYAWITPEIVLLRSRGRATHTRPVAYAPGRGDVIVTNWSSWVEVLWLAINFAPIFALPVVDGNDYDGPSLPERQSGRAASGRHLRSRTGGVASDAADGPKRKILGFRSVNWITAARAVGRLPAVKSKGLECFPLDQICADANGPVVLFPECVTSNNRALLRPAGCFPESWRQAFKLTAALRLGGSSPKLFLASFKHGPPTAGSISSVVSVPSSFASPWPHVWSVCCSFTFNRDFQVRLLHPAESPTSASFIGDAAAAAMAREDPVSDACLTIISSLSRLRRTEIGWEDKESFMQIYKRK